MYALHDLNELQRVLLGRKTTPTAIVLDGRVLQGTPESGHWAGYNGGKQRKGSTPHIAVDTLGLLLSVVITPANQLINRSGRRWASCVGTYRKSPAKP